MKDQTSSSKQNSDSGRTIRDDTINDPMRAHEGENWFHGLLPREDINILLLEEGQFLVRYSEPDPGKGLKAVLSVRWKAKNHHFIINNIGGRVAMEKQQFPSILDMIHYLMKEKKPVTEASGALLLKPLPKQNWELKHDWIELNGLLGEGAFGGVYSGTMKIHGRNVKIAAKVNKGKTVNRETIREICSEARIMRKYRHPHVIKFYGVAIEKEPIMLVMELVNGGALDIYLRKRSDMTSVHDKLRYAFGAAKGMEYLHEKGCIHRDVAARNCLVHDGEVKISDFGLSRQLSDHAAKYKLKDMKERLPIRWLAPEVLTSATYSPKSDVYSYGILLWEIFMNGAIPYPNMTLAEVNKEVRAGYRMPAPDGMPKFVREIMLVQCFPARAEDRSTMREIRESIQDVIDKRTSSCYMRVKSSYMKL